jgi:hypothetical protein
MRPFLGIFSLVILTAPGMMIINSKRIYSSHHSFSRWCFWHGLHDAIGWASGAIIQESSCPVKHPLFAVPKHRLHMQFVLKRNLLGRFWRSFQLLHRFAA